NRSLSPPSGARKPKPLVTLNHFTVPVSGIAQPHAMRSTMAKPVRLVAPESMIVPSEVQGVVVSFHFAQIIPGPPLIAVLALTIFATVVVRQRNSISDGPMSFT